MKEFKYKINENILDEKRDLTVLDTDRRLTNEGKKSCNRKWVKYRCNKCLNEEWVQEKALVGGRGCPYCSNKKVKKGFNDLLTTEPWMIDYLVDIEDGYKYTSKSNQKIMMKCPECGTKKESTPNHLYYQGFSCSSCSDGKSIPNKLMFNILEILNIDFIPEYHPEWSEGRYYDFYIPSKNIIIELDGDFHYRQYNKKSYTIQESQQIDKSKDINAKNNNIDVIRIDCYTNKPSHGYREFIFDCIVFNKELNKIFDFSTLNKLEILNKSSKSLIKQVCDYYNENKVLVKDLAEIFKIERHTVGEYLKLGTSFGWCEYSPNASKMKKINVVNKNNEIIKTYNSLTELSNFSLNDLGVNLNLSLISRAFRDNKTYKGFRFELVQD